MGRRGAFTRPRCPRFDRYRTLRMLSTPLISLMILASSLGGCRGPGECEPDGSAEVGGGDGGAVGNGDGGGEDDGGAAGDGGATGDGGAVGDGGGGRDSGTADDGETVVTYPGPEGVEESSHYAVTVQQGGAAHSSFVYEVNRQQESNASLTTSWTTFSFSGTVTVAVTRLDGAAIARCEVLPSSYDIVTEVSDNTCSFELDRPRKVSVELDRDTTHPMLVFADALETDVPDPDDPDVLYFGPGTHDIGDTVLTSGQTVYIAGGAVVYGRLQVGSPDAMADERGITVRGRGILSGEGYPHGSTNYDHLINFWGARETLIDGITLVQSPLYNILIYGADSVVRDTKLISWWYSTDGIYVGNGGGLVEDCFVKVNDDAFKLYDSDTTVRDTVIWQLDNGAPFQMSWNMPTDNQGFVVQNIDIIRMEHRTDQINLAAVDAVHGGSGHMSGYLFEDIRIENADWRAFYLTLQRNDFSPPDNEMGQISDVTFRNINVSGALSQPNEIFGWDAYHRVSDVTFQNLKINGNLITSAAEGNFQIDAATTDNIRFEIGTFITDSFYTDAFLKGEDCEARLSDVWADADSVEVYGEQMHLVNTLPDPDAECFTTSGWQPVEPVTPPFTIEYTVDVADSVFGYGGYARASLIWDETNLYGLATDVSLVKELVDWHGKVDGFEDLILEDQYVLYAPGLGLRMATMPSDGVETITIRQVIGENDQQTWWAADDGPFELVHTYDNIIGSSLAITPILVASDCNVWNHNGFDLAIDSVAVFSEDAAPCD